MLPNKIEKVTACQLLVVLVPQVAGKHAKRFKCNRKLMIQTISSIRGMSLWQRNDSFFFFDSAVVLSIRAQNTCEVANGDERHTWQFILCESVLVRNNSNASGNCAISKYLIRFLIICQSIC